MKTIWKYNLPVEDEFTIEMPSGAEILSIQTQGGIGQMWVLVNEGYPTTARKFKTIGTGHPIEGGVCLIDYRGSYQERQFVWHIFERINR